MMFRDTISVNQSRDHAMANQNNSADGDSALPGAPDAGLSDRNGPSDPDNRKH
jgi:hypothetical protein